MIVIGIIFPNQPIIQRKIVAEIKSLLL